MLVKKIPLSYIVAGSTILMAVAFTLKISHLPPQIPLFYSRPIGESQVVDRILIFFLPLLMYIIVGTNSLLVRFSFTESRFVKAVLYYSSVVSVTLITYIFLRIVFLVS